MGVVVIYFISGYAAKTNLLKKGRAIVIDKSNRLKSLPSPKIVLVGGSNICYGINAKLLQDSLQIPVVDMSINAGIGMSFYYQQIKPFLKSGDIVIGIPEYAAYSHTNIYGEAFLYDLCTIEAENYKYLVAMQWLRFPMFMGETIKSNMSSLSLKKESNHIHGRQLYDTFGSYFGHRNQTFDSTKFISSQKTENYKNKSNQIIQPSFIKLVSDFNTFCRQKQVTYLHSVPVYAKIYYDSSYMSGIFKKLNGVNIINKPERYLYEMNEMFDTPNHILFSFKQDRTIKLLFDIRQALQKNR